MKTKVPLNSNKWYARQRSATRTSLVPLLQGRLRLEFILGSMAWLIAFLYFWVWWLKPEHNISTWTYGYVSILQAWITFLPGYFLAIDYMLPAWPTALHCSAILHIKFRSAKKYKNPCYLPYVFSLSKSIDLLLPNHL